MFVRSCIHSVYSLRRNGLDYMTIGLLMTRRRIHSSSDENVLTTRQLEWVGGGRPSFGNGTGGKFTDSRKRLLFLVARTTSGGTTSSPKVSWKTPTRPNHSEIEEATRSSSQSSRAVNHVMLDSAELAFPLR